MSIKTGLEYIGYIDPWYDEERLSDEEIVRCRDCKHYDADDMECHENGIRPEPDGYCAWGVRRDEC